MTNRAAAVACAVVLPALAGCGSPSADAPAQRLSDAPPRTIYEASFAGNTCTLEYYNHDNLGAFTH